MMKPFISGVFLLHILPLLTSAQSVHVSNSSMNISAGAFLVVPGDMYFSGNGSILNHGNIQVKGNWNNNGLGLTIGPTGTTAFNGNATQVIDGGNVTTFHHLQLNNPSGVQLAIDAHTSGQLSFIDGKLTTGSEVFHIISQPPVPISGASTTRYVNGYLGAPYGTGNTFFKYEIGNTVYAPVTLNITGVTVPGEIIAFTAPGPPPSENIPFANASGINQNAKVDQFWELAPSGIQGGTATASFEFTYTSYNGNPASYIVRKHDPANGWTSESGLLLISTMQASALSSFGEFEIGEDLNVGLNASGEHAAGVISPNPSDGNFSITFENNISNRFHLDLYDNTGKLVWSDTRMGISGNSITVTVPPLNKGLYLLRAGNPAEGYHHYKLHFE